MRFDTTHRDRLTRATIAPGITAVRYPSGPDGAVVMQVDFKPGARWPGIDHHPTAEIIMVLDGELVDGEGTHRAGTYIYGHPGSEHSPASTTGCTLLAIYPEGLHDAARATRGSGFGGWSGRQAAR
ncbi:cupin domain-containing protein [Kitasatospora sp. NPDC001574]